MLTVGAEYALRIERGRLDVERAFSAATASSATDFVDSILPSPDREEVLAGLVTHDGFRLRRRDRDRQPWWLLEPVFVGQVADAGSGCEVHGRLRVRRRTLAGLAMIALALWLLAGPVPVAVGIAILVVEVLIALPHTTTALLQRVRSVAQSVS